MKLGVYYSRKKLRILVVRRFPVTTCPIMFCSYLCLYSVTDASNKAFITEYEHNYKTSASAAHEEYLILYKEHLFLIINMWLKKATLTDPFSMTRFSMTTPRLLCSHTISQKCPHVLGKGPFKKKREREIKYCKCLWYLRNLWISCNHHAKCHSNLLIYLTKNILVYCVQI